MVSFHFGSALASATVLAPDTSSELPKSFSVKAPSSLGSGTWRRVRITVLYLRLSPIIIALEMPGRSSLSLSSTGTGAMFSPPAVMMSSLMRPVMASMSVSASTLPTSPDLSQPSSSMVSSVLAWLCM